jgi:PqqD family protein of HPr-rel-A system
MAGLLWRAAWPDRLLVRPLDALTLIFDRASGETHLLASPQPEILALLADAPLRADALLAKLAAEFDLDADGDALTVLTERLQELAALGLVEPCPA